MQNQLNELKRLNSVNALENVGGKNHFFLFNANLAADKLNYAEQ